MTASRRASLLISLFFLACAACNTEFESDLDGDAPDGFDASTEVPADAGPDGVPDAEPDGGPECGNGEVEGDEQCDDGNDVDGDGCDSDCTYSCAGDEDCLDDNECNGAEICDADTHACSEGTPLEDGHLLDVGPPRIICLDGNPAESECGDGFVDEAGGEFCDPPGVGGCTDDCRWGCDSDTDCPDDGELCNGEEYCDTGAHVCDRRAVPSSGTACDDGLFCTTDETCDGAGSCTGGDPTCVDGLTCTDDRCDESTDACDHPLIGGNCLIGGTCYADGALNPSDECEECRSSSSTSAFVDRSDGSACPDEGVSCTDDVCLSGTCSHPVSSGQCLIDGSCHSDGTPNPSNECEECDSGTSSGGWTPLSDGTACTADAYSCTDDECRSGACDHLLVSGWCLIDGTCYTDSTRDSRNECHVCDTSASETSWTVDVGHACDDGEWCTAGDACTSSGACVGTTVLYLSTARQISAGLHHGCALVDTDRLRCWGHNTNGQVGDGSLSTRDRPVDVTGMTSGVAYVGAGANHTCAVTTSGAAHCWGDNYEGQLGDGTTTDSDVPVAVSGLSSGVHSICGGYFHSCALLSSGQVRCWGRNAYGQLGNASTTDSEVPVTVVPVTGGGALIDIAEIDCGNYHNCARTSSGNVVCWGSNFQGQLGGGETAPSTSSRPLYVHTDSGSSTPLPDVARIGLGGNHSCAVMTDTRLKCWGWGVDGQLGNGGTDSQDTPTYVMVGSIVFVFMSGVTEVSGGSNHTCARVSGDEVRCWGLGEDGQLGNGSSGPGVMSALPVFVQDGSGVNFSPATSLSLGGWHSLAIAGSSDYVWGWGRNDFGQLGMGGSGSDRPHPFHTVCGL
jgi:cysteine-rich repeat protein